MVGPRLNTAATSSRDSYTHRLAVAYKGPGNIDVSQGVEYFMEWILNPTNKGFEEIRQGWLVVLCE